MSRELDEATVEGIVRWYILNGGTSGTMRLVPEFATGGVDFNPWGVRDLIGVTLAECSYRVPAGNPFDDDATITAVERAIIAEVAYKDLCREAAILQTMQGRDSWPETRETERDRDLWYRMMARYRGDPTWAPAMAWLRQAFGRLVHGDEVRGQRGDAAFLVYITGT